MPSILAFGKYYIYLFLFNMGEEGKGRDEERGKSTHGSRDVNTGMEHTRLVVQQVSRDPPVFTFLELQL